MTGKPDEQTVHVAEYTEICELKINSYVFVLCKYFVVCHRKYRFLQFIVVFYNTRDLKAGNQKPN